MVAISLGVIAVSIVAFVTFLSSRGDVRIRLGDERFNVGDAEEVARLVTEGGPLLFSDPSGGQRDILVNHLSDDPGEGWVAFDARLPGDERSCQLQWNPPRNAFGYNCDSTLTFPPDGQGLTPYPVDVVDGRIIVDINAATRPSTTVGPSSTSPVVISGS